MPAKYDIVRGGNQSKESREAGGKGTAEKESVSEVYRNEK